MQSAAPVAALEEVTILEKASKPSQDTTRDYALKFACASMSAMLASGVSNPLDMYSTLSSVLRRMLSGFTDYAIKVRQQLRTQIPGSRANAFWAIGIEMAHTEGILSLMNGFTASMLRELVYSGFRLGAYEFFKDQLHAASNGALTREGISLKVLAAMCSSSIGSAIANPTDVVKVRMQAHYPDGRPYETTRHAFASVFKEGMHTPAFASYPILGGFRVLYRGVEATTARGVILSISQICSYDHIKQTLKRRGLMQEGMGLHLTASVLAGLFCSITSSPVDVVKVRLMNDKHRQIEGVVHCAKNILMHEGPLAFYKGFGMCWGRLGTHTIVSFIVFERLRQFFGIDPL